MTDRLLHAIESLALALWVGGLAAFAFVFAPIAFHAVADGHVFAAMTAAILTQFGIFGAVCGLIAIGIELRRAARLRSRRGALLRTGLLVVMLAGSAIETFAVIPQMSAAAANLPPRFQALARTDSRRAAFDRQHQRSSQIYGVVLLCGLGVIVHLALTARPKDSA